VVGDDPDRDIGLLILAILDLGSGTDIVQDRPDGVDFEQIAHTLHDDGKALESSTCVDVFLGQRRIGAIFFFIKLGEDQVPELNVAIAVASDLTGRTVTAECLAAVIINLRAWAARPRAVFPEIVSLAEAENL